MVRCPCEERAAGAEGDHALTALATEYSPPLRETNGRATAELRACLGATRRRRSSCQAYSIGEGREAAAFPDPSLAFGRAGIGDHSRGRPELEPAPGPAPGAGELALADGRADDGVPHGEQQDEAATRLEPK